jgi:transcription termination factor NusB
VLRSPSIAADVADRPFAYCHPIAVDTVLIATIRVDLGCNAHIERLRSKRPETDTEDKVVMITIRCTIVVVIVVMLTIGKHSVAGFSNFHRLAGVSFATNEKRLGRKRPIQFLEASGESQEVMDKVQSKQITARSVAAHALLENGKRQSVPSLQRLESDPLFKSLGDQRDRSFARLLVTTVERRMGQIDKVLAKCNKKTDRPTGRRRKDDTYVQACLRIGAAQLLFTDTPVYAAVKETIDALRQDDNIKVP